MLQEMQLQNFRCFESLRAKFAPGFNFFLGANGAGKTSILEAACVLLRLQSQRSTSLAPLVQFGRKWFAISGRVSAHLLEFRYSSLRRQIAFDGVEQRTADEYLRACRVVSFANMDIEIVRGSSEQRRRYLNFIGAQIYPGYRAILRAYERALRSRNALLKSAQPREREIAAYDKPLLEYGSELGRLRAQIVDRVAPFASAAYAQISGGSEALELQMLSGNEADFAADLARSHAQERRMRQTIVGPHRDDIALRVDQNVAAEFASEGQQRSVALAMKIAQAAMFHAEDGAPPLLLIDDIFGELDQNRRNALLAALPQASQKFVTATAMSWRESAGGATFEVRDREVTPA